MSQQTDGAAVHYTTVQINRQNLPNVQETRKVVSNLNKRITKSCNGLFELPYVFSIRLYLLILLIVFFYFGRHYIVHYIMYITLCTGHVAWRDRNSVLCFAFVFECEFGIPLKKPAARCTAVSSTLSDWEPIEVFFFYLFQVDSVERARFLDEPPFRFPRSSPSFISPLCSADWQK